MKYLRHGKIGLGHISQLPYENDFVKINSSEKYVFKKKKTLKWVPVKSFKLNSIRNNLKGPKMTWIPKSLFPKRE